ncbi:hypothetical protein MHYP_G00023500 [Metynnis hypsauchen]
MGAAHFMAQNALLLMVFLLSAIAPSVAVYSSGECTFNTKGTCEYQGQVYGIGDSWVTKDCYHCVCMEPFGVGCCDHNPQPVDYPEWCEIIRKPDSCISVAVMRANHKLPCLTGNLPQRIDRVVNQRREWTPKPPRTLARLVSD